MALKAKKATKKTTTQKPKKKSLLKRVSRKLTPSTEFVLMVPDADEVYLVGDFNDWDGTDYRMRKFKDGSCKKKVKLSPGRYEYRFMVDGNWWTDPQNPNRQVNPFGTENSVITIR